MRQFKLRVWGDYACFTRPEFKSEPYSYDVITPSAAEGILRAIYWKPEMRWVVDKIHVINPIKRTIIKKNEVSHKSNTKCVASDNRQIRTYNILKDVEYIIDAHIEVIYGDYNKHISIFERRASKGQCHHSPCLGIREFMCNFELLENDYVHTSKLDNMHLNASFGPTFNGFIYNDTTSKDKEKVQVVTHNSKTRERGYKYVNMQPVYFNLTLTNGSYSVPYIKQ